MKNQSILSIIIVAVVCAASAFGAETKLKRAQGTTMVVPANVTYSMQAYGSMQDLATALIKSYNKARGTSTQIGLTTGEDAKEILKRLDEGNEDCVLVAATMSIADDISYRAHAGLRAGVRTVKIASDLTSKGHEGIYLIFSDEKWMSFGNHCLSATGQEAIRTQTRFEPLPYNQRYALKN